MKVKANNYIQREEIIKKNKQRKTKDREKDDIQRKKARQLKIRNKGKETAKEWDR